VLSAYSILHPRARAGAGAAGIFLADHAIASPAGTGLIVYSAIAIGTRRAQRRGCGVSRAYRRAHSQHVAYSPVSATAYKADKLVTSRTLALTRERSQYSTAHKKGPASLVAMGPGSWIGGSRLQTSFETQATRRVALPAVHFRFSEALSTPCSIHAV
jgi:hypothetical protein